MSIGNLVAQEMAKIVDSTKHCDIFKLASSDKKCLPTDEKCCNCSPKCEANCQCSNSCCQSCHGCQELKTKANVNQVIDVLIKASIYLNDNGFEKAASKSTKALNSLLLELEKQASGCSGMDCSNSDDGSKSEWLDAFLGDYSDSDNATPSTDTNDVRATDFMTDEELLEYDASDPEALGKSDLIDIDLPESKSFSFPQDPHESDENVEFDINQFVQHSLPEDEGEIPLAEEDPDVQFISKHPTHLRNKTNVDFEGPYLLDEDDEFAPLPPPPPRPTTGYNDETLTEEEMLPEAWGREGSDTLPMEAKKAFKALDQWIAKHADQDLFEDD